MPSTWWHEAYGNEADHDADRDADRDADQFNHLERDRIKWLKFFIYSSAVSIQHGPDRLILQAHKSSINLNIFLNGGMSD